MRKGAIIGFDVFNPIASVVVFQFNPEKMTRTLKPRTSGSEGTLYETQRLKGAPDETIKMELRFSAADRMAEGDSIAEELGLHAQLAALEMLVYPKSALVITNTALLATGRIEIVPPTGPLTLFVWGPQRIVPVQLKECEIVEETFDSTLNPISAKATVTMRVVSYNELSILHPAYWIFMTHQVVKEVFATIGSAQNLSVIGRIFE